jgi:hypothetical protein
LWARNISLKKEVWQEKETYLASAALFVKKALFVGISPCYVPAFTIGFHLDFVLYNAIVKMHHEFLYDKEEVAGANNIPCRKKKVSVSYLGKVLSSIHSSIVTQKLFTGNLILHCFYQNMGRVNIKGKIIKAICTRVSVSISVQHDG